MTYEKFIELGGNDKVPREFFISAKREMLGWINYYTMNRIDYDNSLLVDLVEETLLDLIDYDFNESQDWINSTHRGNIKSESVGGHRVDYAIPQEDEKLRREAKRDANIYEIIKMRFAHTGLMYRGVR